MFQTFERAKKWQPSNPKSNCCLLHKNKTYCIDDLGKTKLIPYYFLNNAGMSYFVINRIFFGKEIFFDSNWETEKWSFIIRMYFWHSQVVRGLIWGNSQKLPERKLIKQEPRICPPWVPWTKTQPLISSPWWIRIFSENIGICIFGW